MKICMLLIFVIPNAGLRFTLSMKAAMIISNGKHASAAAKVLMGLLLFLVSCTISQETTRQMQDRGVFPQEDLLRLESPARKHDFLKTGRLSSSIVLDRLPEIAFSLLPDTSFESTRNLIHHTYHYANGLAPGTRLITDAYPDVEGVLTFRGGASRDMPVSGKISGIPQGISKRWQYVTRYDTTETRYGMWGGGQGWTGQPLLVNWPDGKRNEFGSREDHLLPRESVEVIAGSLSGDIYFLDFETGQEVREPIRTGNPIKGTPTLDPRMNGMLYIGDGVPHNDFFGIHMIDLHRHEPVYFFSGHNDRKAYRRWGAFDSSPLIWGDYLYWPGENGVFYKFLVKNDAIQLVARMVYYVRGEQAAGIESSLAVYRNYGYFGDNHGNILCVNLLTMKPVWHYDNKDDTDATLVMDVVDGIPYLFASTQVDRQGDEGHSRFVKLNGLDGSLIWENKIKAYRVEHYGRMFDGGMYSTPLLGRKKASGLIYANIAHTDEKGSGELIALDAFTGKIKFRTRLASYSWSSPVAFYNEEGELFIFTGDARGNAYLIYGDDGRVIQRSRLGRNFEASPVVWGNSVIIGSRGREIYRLDIE